MNRGFPSFAWWVALSGLLLVGCTHSSLRVGRSRSATLPPSLAADFAYARTSTRPCQVEVLESRPQFTIKRIQLPAVAEGSETKRWIDLDYYDLTSKAKTPVIMVLPMLGGGYALERHFASYFASRGYAAVIVRRDGRTMSAQVEELNRLFRDMVIDHKRVIDWMETQDDLDCSRIGVFGVSMGGIKGALLVPLENRIQAAALGLAGGDLPYILTHTTEPGLVKRREQELRTRNITLEQSEQRLRELITYDPFRYAPYVDAKKVLLVLARYDTVVPIEKGLELKRRMGNPETIMIPAGHYTAVLSIPYIKSQSFDFFEKRFALVKEKNPVKPAGSFTKVQSGP